MKKAPKDTAESAGWSRQLQSILKRRKLALVMIIAAFLLLLVLLNAANFLFLNRMQRQLETELSHRLLSISALAANLVEAQYPEDFLPGPNSQLKLLIIQDWLANIKRQHQLEGLYIIDRRYRTVLDAFPAGELLKRTYLIPDSTWIRRAWAGVPVTSAVHTVGGQHFMSGYAPVRNLSGRVIGVLVAEANADFFLLLDRYRSAYLITAIVSAGIFVLFSAFLVYALRLLMRTQEKLVQTERLALMGQMSAVLAHEIRNPLGIIRGTADVLRARYQNKDRPDPLFEYIPEEINRLNKLVNDFLVLSRDGALNLTLENLNDLVRETVHKMRLDEEQSTVRFELQLDELPPFYFDRDAIEQVLVNLLRNAIQAIDGQGTVTVRTRRAGGSRAEVSVADTGPGIDGDVQRIFEPFYTTKSSGSGLGMPVSKKIIEKHGGNIQIYTEKGKGTTVTFWLPIRKQKE